MRRSKEEQLTRSFEIIEKQAKELVDVYGWNESHVRELADDLKRHAIKEVESFHDTEDVSGCWRLVSWKSDLRVHLGHDFRELEGDDSEKLYRLRGLAYELTDIFNFIENIAIKKLDFIAQFREGNTAFGVKAIDGSWLAWDLVEIEESVKDMGMFEVAKKIYGLLLAKNEELGVVK